MKEVTQEIPEVVRKVIGKSPERVLEVANTYSNEKRYIQKKLRLTERENYLLQYKMNQAGIRNFSLYARHMLLSGMTIHTDFSDLRNLISELGKIGNNINQLAHKANSTNSVAKEDFNQLKKEHDELAKLVNEALLYKLKRARELQRTI
ncbi:plasmid mobilization relaxosome protein MobC [Listeria monocytogenes]|nr:plasmid mobilization relaxosome protein MobC [Listeria monocytogenes]EIZ6653598.1 plasmid mobilization relaxosome protein MobC [Listeria monocytogenes]HDT8000316.1 plasmid mobilization relaxosome protein MobC [Enterococcus faecalis]HDT8188120.1 plasmid mobilization relaxosome protein MobC [Enterococcus faecalis]